MADSLEPYITKNVIFCGFNLVLRCIIQSLLTEKPCHSFLSPDHMFLSQITNFGDFHFLFRIIFFLDNVVLKQRSTNLS